MDTNSIFSLQLFAAFVIDSFRTYQSSWRQAVPMIVCSCNVLSDKDVRATLNGSEVTPRPRKTSQVYGCLGCSAQCGRCARTIRRIMNEALAGAAACACHPDGHK
jgi:bacterioferritin-associated ferredoxin